ncbi:uracil-DNA glycosylase [Candidatus Nitrosocosmicus arcticus]|uniref:Type-4 uracil-DNA glycosylase n=1 Tax=Candidatus Nitrosocosmicus arcticus TaxID=2035267 RepID=A0A557SVP9_9ARCH|nr:uracil-DNA glycosylase [Candidatus Nitrosocosmicus arcticus]TVP40680.1 uracil DNA glycosylase family 4 [Candidatus Nitrosocosmicus arcticus]
MPKLNSQTESLESIKNKVIHCVLCGLSATRKNAVPGSGSVTKKIMLVGEAPGKNEDERGNPFVGSAGKVLDQALIDAGIERKEIYITNVVKCRPPNNRVPTEEEIKICTNQYLKKEIDIISPIVICILGATALKSLLGLEYMTPYRGKIVNRPPLRYFITYHPAATIYNNKLKQVFFKDIEMLAKIVNAEEQRLDRFFLPS